MRHLLSLLIALACSLSACHENVPKTIYHQSRVLPPQGWTREDALSFEVTIQDSTQQAYDIAVEWRLEDNYVFSDINLLFEADIDSTGKQDTLTVHTHVLDQHNVWKGKKGSSGLHQQRMFLKTIHFPQTGIYTLRIRQQMTHDKPLKGIHDVGIIVSYPDDRHPDAGKQTVK